MLLYLIDFLLINIDYTLYTLLFSQYMKKKAGRNMPKTAVMIFFAALIDFISGLAEIHLFSVLVSAICLLMLSAFLFKDQLKHRLVIISLSLLFSFILEMASGFSWAVFFGLPAVSLVDYPAHMLLASAFYLALKMVIILILSRIAPQKDSQELNSAFQLKMALLPIFSLLGIFLCGYQFLIRETPDYLAIVTVTLVIGFLNLLYFAVLSAHRKLFEENLNSQMAAKEYEMKEEYYQALDQHQKEIRTIKHDLKNQLLAISGALDTPGSQLAQKQLNLIMDDLQGQEHIHFTGHKGLNILLGAKYRKASAQHITCDFSIKVPEDLPIEEKDLGSMMGNILDNAIEASQYCPPAQRYIRLKMVYFKNSLVIQSENRTDGQVSDLRTRKADTTGHGLGMNSISHIVGQYHGHMDYKIDSNHFQLYITLWL